MTVAELIKTLSDLPQDVVLKSSANCKWAIGKLIIFADGHELDPVLQIKLTDVGLISTQAKAEDDLMLYGRSHTRITE